MRTSFLFCAGLIGLGALAVVLSLPLPARADALAAQPSASAKAADQAAQLVHSALEAEADGKPDVRANFLHQALAVAPDFAPAHWQSGEIQTGDRWISIDTAAKQDAHSAKLDEYRKLRDQAGATVDEQLDLARWCEKAGLKEQQRAHLMFALELQPNCKEAISKLGLVRYRGELVPAAQLDGIKAQLKQSMAESKEWKARVYGWRQQLQDHLNASHSDLLKQIRDIHDPAAIAPLERYFAKSTLDVHMAIIDSLATMPQQAAVESLIRYAVFSQYGDARQKAAYELKSRPIYCYAPILLAAMKLPIYVEYHVLDLDAHNFTHELSLYQAGAEQDQLYVEYRSSTFTSPKIGPPSAHTHDPDPSPQRTAALAMVTQQNVLAFANRIQEVNEKSDALNSVLAEILQTTTDNQFGADPTAWWSWWANENDYYQPPETPVNVTSNSYTSYSSIPRYPECFVAGTPVSTTSGPMQIENVKVGELVLAEDPETGELAYKPVLATTIRPASPLIEVRIGDTLIRGTRGHPYWVSGKGWQMAKELKAGEWLHTAHNPVQIDSAEPSDEAVCYNLVVADFHDYFVGDAKVLVHDNLLRGPTLATVPGLVDAK